MNKVDYRGKEVVMRNVGENIRLLRESHRWTQEAVAKMMGVDPAFISALERGVKKPGRKTMEKLCDAFGVDELTIRFGERTLPVELTPSQQRIVEIMQPLSEPEQLRLLAEVVEMIEASGQ